MAFCYTLAMRPALLFLICSLLQAENWAAYRGTQATGVSAQSAPLHFNADPTAGPLKSVLWRTHIPGLSHSSPILWDDRLYVATAVRAKGDAPLKIGLYGAGDSADDNSEQSWKLFCLDRKTGRVIWERTAHSGLPRAPRHTKATHANTTLATDGTRAAVAAVAAQATCARRGEDRAGGSRGTIRAQATDPAATAIPTNATSAAIA